MLCQTDLAIACLEEAGIIEEFKWASNADRDGNANYSISLSSAPDKGIDEVVISQKEGMLKIFYIQKPCAYDCKLYREEIMFYANGKIANEQRHDFLGRASQKAVGLRIMLPLLLELLRRGNPETEKLEPNINAMLKTLKGG
jgi:hypothetical protein